MISTREILYFIYPAQPIHGISLIFNLFVSSKLVKLSGFPSQRPLTRNFDLSFIYAWTNGWANTRGAGDLRRHRAHCDVNVMWNIAMHRNSATL